jgi:hypothetical protein
MKSKDAGPEFICPPYSPSHEVTECPGCDPGQDSDDGNLHVAHAIDMMESPDNKNHGGLDGRP